MMWMDGHTSVNQFANQQLENEFECDAQTGTIQLLLDLHLLIYGCKMLKGTEHSPDPGAGQMHLSTWRGWQSVPTPGTQPALL